MNSPNIMILVSGVAVYIAVKRLKTCFKEKWKRRIVGIGKMTLGIYIVHPLVIESLFPALNIGVMNGNPFWTVPVLSVLVFLISLGVTWLLRKLPYLRVLVDWSKNSLKNR